MWFSYIKTPQESTGIIFLSIWRSRFSHFWPLVYKKRNTVQCRERCNNWEPCNTYSLVKILKSNGFLCIVTRIIVHDLQYRTCEASEGCLVAYKSEIFLDFSFIETQFQSIRDWDRLSLGLHGDRECSAENCINLSISEYSNRYDYAGNKKFIGIFEIRNSLNGAKKFCREKPNGEAFMPKNAREMTVFRGLLYKIYGKAYYYQGNNNLILFFVIK